MCFTVLFSHFILYTVPAILVNSRALLVWWFDLNQQLSTQQPPHHNVRERIWRSSRKPCEWRRQSVEKIKNKKEKKWKEAPNQTPSYTNVIPHHQQKDAQLCCEQWLLWNNSLTVIVEHYDTWYDAGLCVKFSHLSQQCPLPDSFPPSAYLWLWDWGCHRMMNSRPGCCLVTPKTPSSAPNKSPTYRTAPYGLAL